MRAPMSCAHFTTGVPCTAAHCTPHATRIPAYTHHRPHLFGWRLHSKHHWCTSPCTAAHCTSHATRNPACAHHITSTSTRHTQSCMRSPHYLNKHTPHALVLALTTGLTCLDGGCCGGIAEGWVTPCLLALRCADASSSNCAKSSSPSSSSMLCVCIILSRK